MGPRGPWSRPGAFVRCSAARRSQIAALASWWPNLAEASLSEGKATASSAASLEGIKSLPIQQPSPSTRRRAVPATGTVRLLQQRSCQSLWTSERSPARARGGRWIDEVDLVQQGARRI